MCSNPSGSHAYSRAHRHLEFCTSGNDSKTESTTLASAGAGLGSQQTGSLVETVQRYIPGTNANRESHHEQGRVTGPDSSHIGSGSQGYGSSSGNQPYGSSNTGSSTVSGGLMSSIPGTHANRQSHAEYGQDSTPYGSAGNNTSSNVAGTVASNIPGTEASRQSHAEQGQDSSSYTSGNDTGSNTVGGVMSHIPGTEANRQSTGEHGQVSTPHGSAGNSTSGHTGGTVSSNFLGTETNRQSRPEQGQDFSSHSAGSNTGGGLKSYIPGTEANRETHSEQAQQQPAMTGSLGTATGMGTAASASQRPAVQAPYQGSQSNLPNPFATAQARAPPSGSTGTAASYASQRGNDGPAYTASGMSQESPAVQHSSELSSRSAAAGHTAEGQGTGLMGKLKAATGMGGGEGTELGGSSSWSTNQNPTFDSDTPRSAVGAVPVTAFTEAEPISHRRTTVSDLPPSASWGSSDQTATYAATQAEPGKPVCKQC